MVFNRQDNILGQLPFVEDGIENIPHILIFTKLRIFKGDIHIGLRQDHINI